MNEDTVKQIVEDVFAALVRRDALRPEENWGVSAWADVDASVREALTKNHLIDVGLCRAEVGRSDEIVALCGRVLPCAHHGFEGAKS